MKALAHGRTLLGAVATFVLTLLPPAHGSAGRNQADTPDDSVGTSTATPEFNNTSTVEDSTASDSLAVGNSGAEDSKDGKLSIREQLGDPFTEEFEWLPVEDSAWGDTLVAGEPPQKGAIQLFSLIKVRDSANYRNSVSELYVRTRITSSEGVDLGEVEWIGVEGSYEGLVIRGRTVHPDGSSVELDTSQIRRTDNQVDDEVMQHNWSFSLPAVTDDCIIEYYIKVTEQSGDMHRWDYQENIPCKRATFFWYPTSRVFDRGMTLELLRMFADLGLDVIIDGGNEKELVRDKRSKAYLWRNSAGKTSVLGAPEAHPRAFAFTVTDIPAFEVEPWSFPENLQRANLLVYRTSSEIGDAFWKKRVRWNADYYTSFSLKRKRMKKVLKKVMKDLPREEWVPAMYNWAQERFLNVSCALWYSERELAKKLKIIAKRKRKKKFNLGYDSMDDAIKKRIAYPNQINMIFCAALEDMGLDADMVFLVDRTNAMFSRDIPIWQFDRTVVAVHDSLTGEVTCYDPASPYLAPGETRWQTQGVTGLVTTGGDQLFLPTPVGKASANTFSRSYNVLELESDHWRGEVTERFTGQPAIALRGQLWPHEDQYHAAETMRHLGVEEGAFDPDSVTVSGVWQVGRPLTVRYIVDGQFTQQAGGSVRLVRLGDIFSDYHSPFSSEERSLPVIFHFPYIRNDVARFTVEAPWTVSGAPDPQDHECQFGSCMQSVKTIGEYVSIQRRFVIASPFAAPTDYSLVRDLFSAREALNEDVIALTQ